MEINGIIIGLIVTLLGFYSFIFFIRYKIRLLELKIKDVFEKRTGIVPSIFEITKSYLNKHDDIFKNILLHRKIEFSQIDYENNFLKLLHTETLIHNELNFIFKVCNKHNKLLKDGRFIYLRDIIINRSYEIGVLIKIYKDGISKYNKLITIKNLTIVGIAIPLEKKYI